MKLGVTQFHENKGLVGWVQTRPGRLVFWCFGTALLFYHDQTFIMPACLATVMAFPARRRLVLSVAAAAVIADRFLSFEPALASAVMPYRWVLAAAVIPVGIGLLYLTYWLAQRFRQWPRIASRHPVLTVHLAIWCALALGTLPWLGALGITSFFAWRLSYLAVSASRGTVAGSRFQDHLFYLVPVFGGLSLPLGKGLDFLSRHEAGSPEAFARSQLAGIKLLLLAILWAWTLEVVDAFFFGQPLSALSSVASVEMSLGWNTLPQLLQSGAHPAWYLGWTAIYLELVQTTLDLAVRGHVIVGCLRLLGFNVFRNTYKPLLSQSILEFWNRYFYYFKELLVDFFFYPTYLALRRLSPPVRMFAAVFAAAFIGNMYHHMLISPNEILHFDLSGLWTTWNSRLVYCLLLASGIWVSMMRQAKLRTMSRPAGLITRLRRIAGVWTFYSIIRIWNVKPRGISIQDRTDFFFSLFGI